jgi:diguanylate cyclase (GGDEF)-like protein/PAS domain S-box-containing protein
MRIRSQLLGMVAAAVFGVVAIAALVLTAARREDAAGEAQRLAQVTAHEVAGLLTLTQEYARYAEPRAAEQWRRRQQAIAATLNSRSESLPGGAALTELKAAATALPLLFTRLEQLGPVRDAFTERRQVALVDQLLTSSQTMSDHAYQWFQDAAGARAAAEHEFRLVVFAAVLLMLVLLAGIALAVRQRVLVPLARLERATAALRDGNLAFRLASTAADEFGDLSRQFDAMADAVADSRERILRSERRLRAITDNLPALVGYVDAQETYRFTNAHYRTLLGVDPESFIGVTVEQRLGSAVYQDIRDEVHAALRGERRRFERCRVANGVDTYLHLDYIPDVDSSGRVDGFYFMVSDITERKQAELRIARSEQRLLDLMNNIPAMVGYFDMEERCLYANDTGLKSQGLERSELSGLTLRDVLGSANYAQHEPFVREALQGRRARLNGTVPFDDRPAHFQAHLIPDRVDGGAQRGFYLMTFDITALREAQLRQSRVENQLRAITDNLPVLIAYIDGRERYAFLNRTFKAWYGTDPATAVGREVVEVLDAELYARSCEPLRRALAGERVSFDLDTEVHGVRRSLHNLYIPDIEPDGRIAGLYALSTDVSALKAAERQMAMLARSDTLTGLPNRLRFDEALPQVLARARRSRMGVALLFLDVDHFKSINDTLGHAAGDAVLREFAARLRRSVRITDTVARLAGDEFVIALEGLHNDTEAQAVARSILLQVRRPFEIDGRALAVTASIGIAYYDPADGDIEVAALLARSDEALYGAKRAGRDGLHIAARHALPESSVA